MILVVVVVVVVVVARPPLPPPKTRGNVSVESSTRASPHDHQANTPAL